MTLEQANQGFAHWQALAAQCGVVLRCPPPEPTTCCGKGCQGCVWESYFDAAQYWIDDAQQLLNAQECP